MIDVGGGAYEAYDEQGRLMFVRPGIEMSIGKKTIGANEWILAPFGIALIDGFWKEWGVDQKRQPYIHWQDCETRQKYEGSTASGVLVDFVNNELRGEFQPGIMQPLSPVVTSGLEVMPGKEEEIYLQYLDALANAKHPGIKKYLQRHLGIRGRAPRVDKRN